MKCQGCSTCEYFNQCLQVSTIPPQARARSVEALKGIRDFLKIQQLKAGEEARLEAQK